MRNLFLVAALTACTGASTRTPTPVPVEPAAPDPASPDPAAPEPAAPEPAAPTPDIDANAVGPVLRDMSRASLAAAVGEDVLVDAPVHIGEGQMQPGTLVKGGTDRELHIVWVDDTKQAIDHVKVIGSAYVAPGGLSLGASWTDMQTSLGDFQVYGFGWDYGGTVDLAGSNLDAYAGTLILRVGHAPGALRDLDGDALMGDIKLSSKLPELDALAPTLASITVRFSDR